MLLNVSDVFLCNVRTKDALICITSTANPLALVIIIIKVIRVWINLKPIVAGNIILHYSNFIILKLLELSMNS